jgi:phosphatidylserine/phosphatidylglycerophosphate/cardiolipin synthase-like enzyme
VNSTITSVTTVGTTETRTTTTTATVTTRTTATVTVRPEMATCFSIQQDCASLIASLVGRANRSVHVAVYIFTNPSLADALVAAHRRGVNVIVVVERGNANATGSQVGYLRANNITVVLDGNPYLMHHKFAVIDEEIVIVGSYNWTLAAEERNDESVVIIRDRELAQLFEQEFRRILLEAGYE